MRRSLAVVLGGLLVAGWGLAGPVDAQNIVANGGFEFPVVSGMLHTYHAGQSFGGWTVESGDVEVIGNYWTDAEGNQSLDLNGVSVGTIFQDLATAVGTAYTLSFAMAANAEGGPAIKTMEVFWGALSLGTFSFDGTGRSPTNMGWTYFQVPSLVASSPTTRLRFKSTTALCCWGPGLDDVTVVASTPPTVTPEPVSMALMGTGLVGLGAARRRRRKDVQTEC